MRTLPKGRETIKLEGLDKKHLRRHRPNGALGEAVLSASSMRMKGGGKMPPMKCLKYRNKPCQVGAEKYRSGRERDRHQDLLLLQRAGEIAGLVREVAFVLAPGVKIDGEPRARPALRYFADFVYSDVATGKVVVADAKGKPTREYRIKKHLMATVHNIHVLEL